MSDGRRRAIERDVAQGDSEARSRLLAERVRTGDLTQDQLELAAYCGAPDALALFNVEDYQQSTRDGYVWWRRLVINMRDGASCYVRYITIPSGLQYWLSDLGRWGTEPLAHAVLVAARVGRDSLPDCSCCSDRDCCTGCAGCQRKEPATAAIMAAESGDMVRVRQIMATRGDPWLVGLLAADYQRPNEVAVSSVLAASRPGLIGENELMREISDALIERALGKTV